MGKRILIVDDDAAIREMMRLALSFEGYTVFSAANGQEGLELLAKIPRPSLVLLDLMMPVLGGWGFSKALEENESLASIPVVVITAFSRNAKPIKARKFLEKPIELEYLYAVAREYAGGGA